MIFWSTFLHLSSLAHTSINVIHSLNFRSAYRWWQTVLDTILSPVSQSERTGYNRYHDAVHVEPSILLKKRGMWGCLLAAVTAVNISRWAFSLCEQQVAVMWLLWPAFKHNSLHKCYEVYPVGHFSCFVSKWCPAHQPPFSVTALIYLYKPVKNKCI